MIKSPLPADPSALPTGIGDFAALSRHAFCPIALMKVKSRSGLIGRRFFGIRLRIPKPTAHRPPLPPQAISGAPPLVVWVLTAATTWMSGRRLKLLGVSKLNTKLVDYLNKISSARKFLAFSRMGRCLGDWLVKSIGARDYISSVAVGIVGEIRHPLNCRKLL